ncbi:lysosomal proton-coupled steroid conjugate and bile acid symporter SLC46A3-like [Ylistrum balloti]|uniref:lysosomal proton-coupled steroid conjugate and bile acid symporter SLC46A3-like n=1 Tax=Ylistrum balloti TaxID=509963 RepID=UPI002905E871|nr:lysosomal proton-coupled steroid conjugate and bile acid symporter SLC46A3-like [Ylistrum balloti]
METPDLPNKHQQPTKGSPYPVVKAEVKANRFESCEITDETSALLPQSKTADRTGVSVKVPLRFYLLGPIVFIMVFCFATNSLIITQYVYDVIEEEKFPGKLFNKSDDENICYENKSSQEYQDQQVVQRSTSSYIIYVSLSSGIPAIFSNLIFAAMSDRYGRKLFLFINVAGNFIATGMLAVGVYLKWNIYALLAFQFVGGSTGGWIAALSIGFASVADITLAGKPRAFGIVLIEIAVGMGALVGSAVSGYLIDGVGYYTAMAISASVASIAVIFALIFPETFRKDRSRRHSVIQTLKNIFLFYTKDTSSVGKRWKFWTCLVGLFFIFLANFGKIGIETLYQLNSPFCWSHVKVGWYTTLRLGLPLVVGMALIKTFQACMDEHVIGILGTMSYISGYVLEALATTELMMLIVAFISFMGSLPVPIIRAIMSHMTPPEQQGSLFAGVAAVETVCGVVGSVTGNAVYAATVDWFRGFTFLLFAGYNGIASVLIMILFVDSRTKKTEIYT